GCTPDYERVETPERIRQVCGRRRWDLLVGGWNDVRFALDTARFVLAEAVEIRSLSVVNYRSASLLFVVGSDGPEGSQANLLAAAIDSLFRELSASAITEPDSIPGLSVFWAMRTPFTVLPSVTAQVGLNLTDLLTVILGCAEVLVSKLADDRSGIQYVTELT